MDKIDIKSSVEVLIKDNVLYVREYMPSEDRYVCQYVLKIKQKCKDVFLCDEIKEDGALEPCLFLSFSGALQTCGDVIAVEECCDSYMIENAKGVRCFLFETAVGEMTFVEDVIKVKKYYDWYECVAEEEGFFQMITKDEKHESGYYLTPKLKSYYHSKDIQGIIGQPEGQEEDFYYYSKSEEEPVFLGTMIADGFFVEQREDGSQWLSYINKGLERVKIKSCRHCYACYDDDCPPSYAWGMSVLLASNERVFFFYNKNGFHCKGEWGIYAEVSIHYGKQKNFYYVIDRRGRRDDGFFNVFKVFDGKKTMVKCTKQKDLPEVIKMKDGRDLKVTYVPEKKAFSVEEPTEGNNGKAES